MSLVRKLGEEFQAIGLNFPNYFEYKPRFLGLGSYTEEGFAAMEKAHALGRPLFAMALRTPGLKMVMGTDANAGPHGQNARETIECARIGQKPVEALIDLTYGKYQRYSLSPARGVGYCRHKRIYPCNSRSFL